MGLFEDRLAKGLKDPEFAAGYAEATSELAVESGEAAYTSTDEAQPFAVSAHGLEHFKGVTVEVLLRPGVTLKAPLDSWEVLVLLANDIKAAEVDWIAYGEAQRTTSDAIARSYSGVEELCLWCNHHKHDGNIRCEVQVEPVPFGGTIPCGCTFPDPYSRGNADVKRSG